MTARETLVVVLLVFCMAAVGVAASEPTVKWSWRTFGTFLSVDDKELYGADTLGHTIFKADPTTGSSTTTVKDVDLKFESWFEGATGAIVGAEAGMVPGIATDSLVVRDKKTLKRQWYVNGQFFVAGPGIGTPPFLVSSSRNYVLLTTNASISAYTIQQGGPLPKPLWVATGQFKTDAHNGGATPFAVAPWWGTPGFGGDVLIGAVKLQESAFYGFKVWDVKTGKVLHACNDSTVLSETPFFTIDEDGVAVFQHAYNSLHYSVYDLKTCKVICNLTLPGGDYKNYPRVHIADTTVFASAWVDGRTRANLTIYDAKSCRMKWSYSTPLDAEYSGTAQGVPSKPLVIKDEVWQGFGGNVTILDAATGSLKKQINIFSASSFPLCFSPKLVHFTPNRTVYMGGSAPHGYLFSSGSRTMECPSARIDY